MELGQKQEQGRQITQWSEQQFVQNRYNIWLGSDAPKTIACKELIDNALDQIADKKCLNAYIRIKNNKIEVMDGGAGISTDKDEASGKTHLFLAIGKLYTSSNYDGEESTVGVNGVGSAATNFLSYEFKAGKVKDGSATGYIFIKGSHSDDGETLDTFKADFPFENGFYVSADFNYEDKKEEILDDEIDILWLKNYIKKRVGELRKNTVVYFEVENNCIEFNKKIDDKNYIDSWEEQVIKIEGTQIIKYEGWKYAFAKEKNDFDSITSMVQGAPVESTSNFYAGFDMDDTIVRIPVPYTMFYAGKIPPKYTDQTKRKITVSNSNMMNVLKLSSLYSYFRQEAEAMFLNKMIKNKETSAYWPAWNKKYKELFIAEGHSAANAIKAQRDNKNGTQACLALRGKILNTYMKSLKSAMRSPIVNELLTVLNHDTFDKIIICCDADDHGAHICTLLIGLLATFQKHLFDEGKIYYCKTPLYIFSKGKEMKWSDDPNDCPKGWELKTNKGLGSLSAKQVKKFITDEETREILQFNFDKDADHWLYHALIEGGKRWIHNYDQLYNVADNTDTEAEE